MSDISFRIFKYLSTSTDFNMTTGDLPTEH